MPTRLSALILLGMLLCGALGAHETMFGLGPRTIWKNGVARRGYDTSNSIWTRWNDPRQTPLPSV